MTHPKPNPAPVVTRADREAAVRILEIHERFADETPCQCQEHRWVAKAALAIATAREAGKLEERAKVVAWLRAKAAAMRSVVKVGWHNAAVSIEAAEHEKGGGDG